MPLFHRTDRRHRVLYDVHAWVGVCAGLVLYLMFITGIVALVWESIEAWEEPAHHTAPAGDVDTWWRALEDEAESTDTRLYLMLPDPESGQQAPLAYVRAPEKETRTLVWSEQGWRPSTARAGGFLLRVHFLFHAAVPLLYPVAGLLSVAMMLLLLTGLGIHLRDLLPQLHTFRPRLKRKAVWSDLHKLTAVAGLPFQFMIAYTGALIVLGTYSIALVGFPLYSDNFERAQEVAFGAPPPSIDAPEVPAEQAPASRWIATAEAALPSMRVERLTTKGPRLRTTVIEVSGRPSAAPGSVNVWVSGSDAEVLGVRAPQNSTPAVEAQRWLLGLHFAEFGGWALDLLYALLAAITGATIISGNALWLARRRRQADRRSDRVLARLTVGFAAGVPLAIGLTLLMSRVLPMSWQDRGPWIDLAFLAALAAACLVAGWLRTTSSAYAWLLYAAAASFAALPLAQRFALEWEGSGPWGGPDGVLMGVELGFVVTAVMLAAVAHAIARRGGSS